MSAQRVARLARWILIVTATAAITLLAYASAHHAHDWAIGLAFALLAAFAGITWIDAECRKRQPPPSRLSPRQKQEIAKRAAAAQHRYNRRPVMRELDRVLWETELEDITQWYEL